MIFLSLSWLWDRLAPPVRFVLERIPLEGVKQAVIRFMDRLPPYPTLFVFLIPIIVIEPLKVVSVWIFAKGQFFAGVATYVGAEILRFSLVAFLFKACRDKLLSIGWFARLYALFLLAHEWAHRQVAPVVAALREWMRAIGWSDSGRGLMARARVLWRFCRRGRAARF